MIRVLTEWAPDYDHEGIILDSGHSWVKGAALIMSAIHGRNGEDAGTEQIRDTANALFTFEELNGTNRGMRSNAAAADDTHGILVGTSTTAPVKDNHALTTKIDDGSAAGELDYRATLVGKPYAVTGGYRVTISRQFDNNSGGTITVEECGLVWRCEDSGLGDRNVLVIHEPETQGILDLTSIIFKFHLDFLV